MGEVNIGKAVVGGLLLVLAGVAVILRRFPADLFDVFWLVAVLTSGIYHVMEAAGPLSLRLRLLKWRTSRKGKLYEWGSYVIILGLFVLDYGTGLPFIFLAILSIIYILGQKRYYRNLNKEKERLQQKVNTM